MAIERFTNRLRKVLALATELAKELRHPEINTGHLLFALTQFDGNIASYVLRQFQAEPERIKEMIGSMTASVDLSEPFNNEDMCLSAGVKTVLELTISEARKIGDSYIDMEHLLLGLISYPDGMAVNILNQLGIRTEDVRHQVTRLFREIPEELEPQSLNRQEPSLQEKLTTLWRGLWAKKG